MWCGDRLFLCDFRNDFVRFFSVCCAGSFILLGWSAVKGVFFLGVLFISQIVRPATGVCLWYNF